MAPIPRLMSDMGRRMRPRATWKMSCNDLYHIFCSDTMYVRFCMLDMAGSERSISAPGLITSYHTLACFYRKRMLVISPGLNPYQPSGYAFKLDMGVSG